MALGICNPTEWSRVFRMFASNTASKVSLTENIPWVENHGGRRKVLQTALIIYIYIYILLLMTGTRSNI